MVPTEIEYYRKCTDIPREEEQAYCRTLKPSLTPFSLRLESLKRAVKPLPQAVTQTENRDRATTGINLLEVVLPLASSRDLQCQQRTLMQPADALKSGSRGGCLQIRAAPYHGVVRGVVASLCLITNLAWLEVFVRGRGRVSKTFHT